MATIKYKDENGEWQEIAIGGGESVEVVDSLESESTTAALSANQGRVLKEMIVQSGGGGGLETRILYVPDYTAGETLTDEEKAYNLETCQKLLAGTARAVMALEGIIFIPSEGVMDLYSLGMEGFLIDFNWGHYLQLGTVLIGSDGDVLEVGEASSSSGGYAIPYSPDGISDPSIYTEILTSLYLGKLPCVYYQWEHSNSSYELFTSCLIANGVIVYATKFDETKRIGNISLWMTDTGFIPSPVINPKRVYINSSYELDVANNKLWMVNDFVDMPMICYGVSSNGISNYFVPIHKKKGDGYVDFIIYRNETYETWRIMDDGTQSIVTE